MNKRGQFFIVAAIIIVGLIIGFSTTVNSVNVRNENEAFYTLADEIGFETKRVLDYGVYNAENTDELIENFIGSYVEYIGQDQVLFVYGDKNGVSGIVFQNDEVGNVGISTGATPSVITIQETTGAQANVNYDPSIYQVSVEINGVMYPFSLREGENFFFVIIKENEDEKFVASG